MKPLQTVASGLFLIALPLTAQIKYIGSSTVGKFMYEAEKVYTASKFTINTKPESGGGENAVSMGQADLGGVARDVKPEIIAKGVNKFLIGKDAIGVWINGANPVKDLTSEQLKGIFTGRITNWKEVGGNDAVINVYIVNPQSATRKVFKNAILGEAEYAGDHIETIRPDTDIVVKVQNDPNGIGQLSFALGQETNNVHRIAVDGQTPKVTNPSYPITRPLHFITKGEPTGEVKAFIDWTLSDEGQAVVKKNFVGVK